MVTETLRRVLRLLPAGLSPVGRAPPAGHTRSMSTPAPDPVARVRAIFDTVADDYDQSGVPFFVPAAQGLVEALAPRQGERALDIGCGRGAATTLLARAVLPDRGGRRGRRQPRDGRAHPGPARRAGLPARTAVMDAGDPDLPPASFDVVASSLVLFFLPDPAAALARWVGLLAPGGRIGLTTFGEEHPVWTASNALFRPWLPPGMLDPKVVGPDAPFSSDAGMEALLRDAGATDVRTVTRRVDVPWGDVEGWKAFSMSTGQRAMWAMVPAEERDGLEARAAEILQDARDDDRPGGHLAGHALHPRPRGLTAHAPRREPIVPAESPSVRLAKTSTTALTMKVKALTQVTQRSAGAR